MRERGSAEKLLDVKKYSRARLIRSRASDGWTGGGKKRKCNAMQSRFFLSFLVLFERCAFVKIARRIFPSVYIFSFFTALCVLLPDDVYHP